MELSRKQLEFLSWSSSLDLTEEEIHDLQLDLKKILTYVENLQELSTDQVDPLVSPLDNIVGNCVREDLIEQSESAESILLENAPSHTAKMIRVPTVIEKGDQDDAL